MSEGKYISKQEYIGALENSILELEKDKEKLKKELEETKLLLDEQALTAAYINGVETARKESKKELEEVKGENKEFQKYKSIVEGIAKGHNLQLGNDYMKRCIKKCSMIVENSKRIDKLLNNKD